MGQVSRQAKYNKVWSWVEASFEGYTDLISDLLCRLNDNQLDELLVDKEITNEQENENEKD